MNETENQDEVIICCDCGEKFIWEKGEQLFYEQRGFLPPRRCPDCRRELKLKRRGDKRRVREVEHELQ